MVNKKEIDLLEVWKIKKLSYEFGSILWLIILILLYKFGYIFFFWWVLIGGGIDIIIEAIELRKLEKKLGIREK